MEITSIDLEKLTLGVQGALSQEFVFDHKLEFIQQVTADAIVYQFRAHLWSESVGPTNVRYPRDWWQALKERWFPQWLKKRYPVEYEVRNLDWRAVYPDFAPSVEGQRCTVHKVKDWTEILTNV